MNFKHMLLATVGLATLAASPALAIDGLSGNAAITTNYVWRGVTQSADNPAVQAGLDFALGDSGFAVGTWASSIDFGDDSPMELDIYGSYSGNFSDAFGYTVGVIGYLYPNQASTSPGYDFYEVYGGLSYDFGPLAVSGKVYYSPDLLGTSTWYYTGGVAVPLGEYFAATANIGSYNFEAGPDYTDWNVGLAATIDSYTISATYTQADLPGAAGDSKLIGAISFVH
jgi:uncharacterized protein (TIGR02001 family)